MKMADKEIGESLKKISANLESIDKTLKESRLEDKVTTDSEEWKKRIENLVSRVDCECKRRLFTPIGLVSIAVIAGIFLIVALLLIWLNFAVARAIVSSASLVNQTQPDSQLKLLVEQIPSFANLSISISALIIAMGAGILYPSMRILKPEELASWYYRKLAKDVDAKDRPYLRALINMKSKEFDLSLWENYQNCIRLNCDLFTEESLLKNLLTQ
jgi:hypothetical protein